MKKFQYLILLNAMCIVLSACNKIHVEPSLPAETQIGAKTFGCKVNGKVWVADAPFPLIRLSGGWYKGSIYIMGTNNSGNTRQTIYLRRINTITTGTYILNNSINEQANLTNLKTACDYYTDSLNTGHLTITRLDTINGIISGRFDFKVKQAGCPDIQVTEGRFDYNYH